MSPDCTASLDLPATDPTVTDVVEAFLSLSARNDAVAIPDDDIDAETTLLEAVVDEVSPTDVFWDVGAHVGMFGAAVRAVANPQRVVAFEPNPHVLPVLEAVLAGLDGTNRAYEVAISDTSGTQAFAADPGGGSQSTFPGTDSVASEHDDFETVTAETQTVADVLADGESVPDVVKIDVEGAEDAVLRSLADVVADLRCLFVEVHHLDRRFTEVDDFFADHGFETEILDTRHQTKTCYQEFVRVEP